MNKIMSPTVVKWYGGAAIRVTFNPGEILEMN